MANKSPSEVGKSVWQFCTRQRFHCCGCEVVFSSAASLSNHRCLQPKPLPCKPEATEASLAQTSIGKKGLREQSACQNTLASVNERLGPLATISEADVQAVSLKITPQESGSSQHDETEASTSKHLVVAGRHKRHSYSCSVCKRVFSSPGKLQQHGCAHTGERPFSCPACAKAFSSKFKLGRHQLTHSAERRHACTVCARTFHRKDHLKNHALVHDPQRKYQCERAGCGKEYNSAASYRKHCARHAAEDGSLLCLICQLVCVDKPTLLEHLKVHSAVRGVRGSTERRFQCPECSRRFFTRKDIKRHLVVHTGQRDFVCDVCAQKFGRKDHLVRHIKKSHGLTDITFKLETTPGPSTTDHSHPEFQEEAQEPTIVVTQPAPASLILCLSDPSLSEVSLSTSVELDKRQILGESSESSYLQVLLEENIKSEPSALDDASFDQETDDLRHILGLYLPKEEMCGYRPSSSFLGPELTRSTSEQLLNSSLFQMQGELSESKEFQMLHRFSDGKFQLLDEGKEFRDELCERKEFFSELHEEKQFQVSDVLKESEQIPLPDHGLSEEQNFHILSGLNEGKEFKAGDMVEGKEIRVVNISQLTLPDNSVTEESVSPSQLMSTLGEVFSSLPSSTESQLLLTHEDLLLVTSTDILGGNTPADSSPTSDDLSSLPDFEQMFP